MDAVIKISDDKIMKSKTFLFTKFVLCLRPALANVTFSQQGVVTEDSETAMDPA
jgi:hypothetical protein